MTEGRYPTTDVGSNLSQRRANLVEFDAGSIGSSLPETIGRARPIGREAADPTAAHRAKKRTCQRAGTQQHHGCAMFAPLK